MGGAIPKQYLPLRRRTVIEYAMRPLCNHPRMRGVVVAIASDDQWWTGLALDFSLKPITVIGGGQRRHSVLNGLVALSDIATADDWVLVHDAARPCLRTADVDRLLETLQDHPVGGLLGIPVTDTVKRAHKNGTVVETVDRTGLWRAMTPQMFRIGALRTALENAIAKGYPVTDEAGAMEYTGQRPVIIEGHADNIKITRSHDLALAELYLKQQLADT